MRFNERLKIICRRLASFFLLTFADEQSEQEYAKYEESKLDLANKRNLFVSLLLVLISAFTIIFRKLILDAEQKLAFDVINIVLLILNLASTIYSLFKFTKFDFLKRRIKIFNILLGINYFSLCFDYFSIFSQLKLNIDNIEIFSFIISLKFCCNILLVFNMCDNFRVILISGSIALTLECILINTYSIFQTPFIYLTLSLHCFCCLFISYFNEAKERASFLLIRQRESKINSLNKELKQPNYYKVLCDNLKYSFLTLTNTSNIEFVNKSMCKLIKTYQAENYEFSHNEKEFEDKTTTYDNLLNTLKPKVEEINKNQNNKNGFTTIYIQNILSKISSVNEELMTSNKELYDYLINIRISNLKKQFLEVQEFKFEEFLKIINKENKENEESENKTLGVVDQPKVLNNLFAKNAESSYNNVSNEGILRENMVFLNIVDEVKRKREQEIKYEKCNNTKNENECIYIFLGKITIESLPLNTGGKSKKKDYPIYLIQMTKYKEVSILIEDNHQIIKTERKETAKVCKSLYLSKVSHEFKNPICNLQELISSLTDELDSLGLVKRHRSPILDNSFTVKNESSFGSDHESSYFDGGVSLIIENKNKDCKQLANCVNNLKCTTDMMIQILKDFTFYTKMIDDSDEIQQSAHPYERRGSVMNRSHTSSAFDLEKRSPNNSFFMVNYKECHFKEIILEILNIFKTKSVLESRQAKLSFNVKFLGSLPDLIEIESEHFRSLIFNTVYHLYKNVITGKIEIVISILPLTIMNGSSTRSNRSKNSRIMFEVFVYGITNVKELTENIIIESEESFRSEKKEVKKKVEKRGDTKHRNLSASFFVEHFHLKHIFSLSDNSIRNKFIDNFNKNFHYYLIQIYSKRLGIKLNFDTSKKGELKIFFSIENKIPHNLSKLKSKKFLTSFRAKESTLSVNPIFKKRNSLQFNDPNAINNLLGRRRNTIGFPSNFNFKNTNSPLDINGRRGAIFHKIEEVVEDTKRTKINNYEMNFDYSLYITTNLDVKKMFQNSASDLRADFYIGNSLSQEESNHKTDTLISLKENQDSLQHANKAEGLRSIQPKKLSSNNKEKSIVKLRKRLSEIVLPTNIEKFNDMQFTYTNQRDTLRKSESSVSSKRAKDAKEAKDTIASPVKPTLRSKAKEDLNEGITRVLLCDDENLIRETLHQFFNMLTKDDPSLTFDVQHSKDGFDCLHKIYENHNVGQYFDVLIIDETMPLAKGSQVINFLKTSMKENDLKNFVIVSFTSYNSPDKIDFIYSQGADFVLTKPMEYNEFKKFFEQLPKRNES